jgi:hypothetical protein
MFKRTFVAALLGLLLAGNALAFSKGDFSGAMDGRGALGDAAVQTGGALMTIASAASTSSTEGAGLDYSSAYAGAQRLPFGAVEDRGSNATSMRSFDSVRVAPVPEHRAWMTLVAGIGLIGMLIGRAKRRFF